MVWVIGVDGLLVVGGGSVFDLVKLVKFVMYFGVDSVVQLLKLSVKMMYWLEVQYMGVLYILVFIIVGIGVEVINGVVIYNKDLGIKYLIVSYYLELDIVVLDVYMIIGLLFMLIVVIGMDVLIYVVEIMGYLNMGDFILVYVEISVKIILENLFKVVVDGLNLLVCQVMFNVSVMVCSVVVNDFGVVLVYNFVYVFGVVCYIYYGEVNGVLLFIVMEEFVDFYVLVVDCLKGVFGVEGEG